MALQLPWCHHHCCRSLSHVTALCPGQLPGLPAPGTHSHVHCGDQGAALARSVGIPTVQARLGPAAQTGSFRAQTTTDVAAVADGS